MRTQSQCGRPSTRTRETPCLCSASTTLSAMAPTWRCEAAAGDDHVIGDDRFAFQIDAVMSWLFGSLRAAPNDLQDLFGGGTRRGGCGRRLAGGGYAWTGQGLPSPLADRRRIALRPGCLRTYRVIVGIFNLLPPLAARSTTIRTRGRAENPAGRLQERQQSGVALVDAGAGERTRGGRRQRRKVVIRPVNDRDSESCPRARASSSSGGVPRDCRRR